MAADKCLPAIHVGHRRVYGHGTKPFDGDELIPLGSFRTIDKLLIVIERWNYIVLANQKTSWRPYKVIKLPFVAISTKNIETPETRPGCKPTEMNPLGLPLWNATSQSSCFVQTPTSKHSV